MAIKNLQNIPSERSKTPLPFRQVLQTNSYCSNLSLCRTYPVLKTGSVQMDFEKRPTISANHGIRFSLILIRCTPSERNDLWHQPYDNNHRAKRAISDLVEHLFDYMQVRDRACAIKVLVSEPLSREQADRLNDQRSNIANICATVAGAPISMRGGLANKFIGTAIGAAAKWYALDKLPTYHAGDRIVSAEATVDGGIGPQRSIQAMIIKTTIEQRT